MRPAVSLKTILIATAVLAVSFFVSLKTMDWLSPRGTVRAPVLVEPPPLQPATRVSSIIAPVAIALTAIRDAADRGAPRSAASRMAVSAIATGAMMLETRVAGCSGGGSTSTGARTVPRGDSQSIVLRLTKNETASTAVAIRIVLRLTAGRIVPPGLIQPRSLQGGLL